MVFKRGVYTVRLAPALLCCSVILLTHPHCICIHVFLSVNHFVSLAGRCWCEGEDHAQQSLSPMDSMDMGQFLPPSPATSAAPWCGSWRLHWHRYWHQVCALCIYARCMFALSLLTEVAFPSVWKVQDRNGWQTSKGLGKQSLAILVSDRSLLAAKSRAIDFPYCNAAKQRNKLLSRDGRGHRAATCQEE